MIRKFFGRLALLIIMLAVLAGVAAMTINNHIVNREKDNILCTVTEEESLDSATREALQNFDADCIMVLGAGIRDDETPTPMLQDRLDAGILLYKAGVAPKILLTGDNGTLEHNEIHVMLNYVRNAGVPDEDIFCDHAGFSTYDSMYRARDIFGVSRMIVVTQTYHEYRALYIAEQLGLEVVGAGADQETYAGQPLREVREILARDKDFFKALLKPEAEIGGDAIPIDGNGISTHGE